jgi:hypothetical protein
VDGVPEGTIRWFGVPRFMFRICLNHLLHWVAALNSKRRFFFKLLFLQTIGEMMEARPSLQGIHDTRTSTDAMPSSEDANRTPRA